MLDTPTALACEPGYCIDEVVPADGAADVPTDAKIWVFFDQAGRFDPEVTIENLHNNQTVAATTQINPAGQSLTEVRNMVAIVTPEAALEPDTRYRVSFSGGALCGARDSPVDFTTGLTTAAAPTEFTGGIQITSSCVEAPEERNTCNDGTYFPHVSYGVSPAEATTATAFGVYRDGELISMWHETPVEVQMRPEDVETSSCFRLRKFNIAGDDVLHDLDACPEVPSVPACTPDDGGDAGNSGDAGDAGDADVNADASDTTGTVGQTDKVVACGCSSTDPQPPIGAALLALLFVGVRWRKRP
jgi:MYXO-CTERM domain-containing protein